VVLPAGISFFTFQAISYVVDIKRRQLHPVGLLDFAVYLSLFPHLLAGPIVRASEFLPQTRHRIDPRNVEASRALWLISRGLFKKVVIASYLATHAADPLFAVPARHAGVEALFGVYAYAVQIYADFSGYTDIAIGLALLLGIRFPQNFDSPYRSLSLQEFWRRWHMTLSRFLRDYLYIPMGGSRRGPRRTYIPVMATMLLGGLWHGASWRFVFWVGLHGAGLAFERARWQRSRILLTQGAVSGSGAETQAQSEAGTSAAGAAARVWTGRVVAWAVTFNFLCLGWVFFRATSFANAGQVLRQIFPSGRMYRSTRWWFWRATPCWGMLPTPSWPASPATRW
jgi:alginate O-acetyltransferase complex protein AlgI